MQVVLFDIDGTLVRTGGAGSAAFGDALRTEFAIARMAAVSFEGRTDRGIVRELFGHHEVEDSEESWERFCRGYLKHLPERLRERKGEVLPGIAQILAELSQMKNTAVGLLTGNLRAGAQAKLGHYRLWEHFPFGGFGDTHSERNDVAVLAREAIQEAVGHVEPERVWVIGDTPLDIRCARHIGARAVAVGTGNYTAEQLAEYQPDHALADFSHPAALLRLLEG
mgnify:CR=1 FL=1